MKRAVWGTVALLASGAVVARWLASRRAASGPLGDQQESQRWLGVTINLPREKVMPDGSPPEPLSRLNVEVRAEKAPGDRGTELYARPRRAVPKGAAAAVLARLRGSDPRQEVRRALREAKSILETGEVLRTETETEQVVRAGQRAGAARATHPARTGQPAQPKLRDKVVSLAARRAPGEGRL